METTTEIPGSKTKKQGNEILKVIYERRAVRKYKDKPIERKLIEELLDAGRMAPSAINKQPWKFYILTDKEDIAAFQKEISIAALKGVIKSGIKEIVKTTKDIFHFSNGTDFLKTENAIFHGAPVVIFITSPKDNEWAALDIGMCSQNIMLAAKALGLDSCPVGLAKFVEQTKIFSKLNVPAAEKVQLSIIVGYGDETPAVHERNKNNAAFINPSK